MTTPVSSLSNDFPQETRAALGKFESALQNIETAVEDLIAAKRAGKATKEQPIAAAKLSVGCSYALSSLFYMYLKTQGISPNGHIVKDDLDRVKQYMLKIQVVEKAAAESAPKLRINRDAAKRIVSGVVGTKKRGKITSEMDGGKKRARRSRAAD